jgi:hypothetical protein
MASAIIAPGTADLSDYSSRRVTIEVTGGRHQEATRLGTYKMTIPYSCLSRTIQGVHRFGGKVIGVTLLQSIAAEPQFTPSEAALGQAPAPKPPNNTRQAEKPQKQQSKQQPKQQSKQQSKRKHKR